MLGYHAIILHAHLPFVRHPEHPKFLEENWLFEAITESYLPLLEVIQGWQRDGLAAPITLNLSPTLCAMLRDPLLRTRYEQHLNGLLELAEKEIHRTHWDRPFHELAWMYHQRLSRARELWHACGGDLVSAFGRLQEQGRIELVACAATHALLPLLAQHPPSIRAQLLIGRDYYRECFGCDPRGVWLPECAYAPGVEKVLQEANIRWFILDTHGVLHANPRPRYGVFAPLYTPNCVAAFGRDLESARQVWSRQEGYPGDPRYRDFYRDIGYDLDFDYVRPYLPSPNLRGFTGFKYYQITGDTPHKMVYHPAAARDAAAGHAAHFLESRQRQVAELATVMDLPPLIVSPYDAELFGHWWYEGPLFLDFYVRKLCCDQHQIKLITPSQYLRRHPTHQIATPSTSSWGEEGYCKLWLNESNQWILPHLHVAQERMSQLARHHPHADGLKARALKQAARELLLAQASDWPFILRTGTSPDYARRRVKDHLLRFIALHEQLTTTRVSADYIQRLESTDNLFPEINYHYWA